MTTKKYPRSAVRFAWILSLGVLCACVERRLHIRTEPPGATVFVNGVHVGRSPTSWKFDQYGKVLVEAEMDGHEPVQQVVKLKAPVREYVFGSFFSDVVWPGTIHDDHEVELTLKPVREPTAEELDREMSALMERAARMRAEAEKK